MKFRVKIYKVTDDGRDELVIEDDFNAVNMEDFQDEYEDVYWNREDEIEKAFDG